MGRDFATKLQILSGKHQGMLLAVDRMFDRYASLREVRDMVRRDFHEDLAISAVGNYKRKHWKVQKEKIQGQKAIFLAIKEIIGEDGLGAGVMALLWQALQDMTPPQLIGLQRVVHDHEKLELAKQQFALHAQVLRLKMRKDRPGKTLGPNGSPREDGAADFAEAQKVVERIREIFGIGSDSIEPPTERLLGPAEKPPSPEAVAAEGKMSV